MSGLARALGAAAFAWAVAALAVQARAALRSGAPEFGAPAGRARDGVRHAFTAALNPARKDSVRHHPLLFAVGLCLHAGVVAGIAGYVLSLAGAAPPDGPGAALFAGVALAGALAATVLLMRRAAQPIVRAVSVPEDYLAEVLVGTFLAGGAAVALGILPLSAWHLAGALLFVYVPLGKLRHAVFFYVMRADLGRRLGLRGVFHAAP